jgi:hypothetical protein
MLLLSRLNFFENVAIVETLLVLVKQIFCIDRSITKDPITNQSRELDQSIEIALFGGLILDNKK